MLQSSQFWLSYPESLGCNVAGDSPTHNCKKGPPHIFHSKYSNTSSTKRILTLGQRKKAIKFWRNFSSLVIIGLGPVPFNLVLIFLFLLFTIYYFSWIACLTAVYTLLSSVGLYQRCWYENKISYEKQKKSEARKIKYFITA